MISIIVPVYNVDKYLERCVKSLLGQSYSDCEIILVDDGSTDDSGLICDKFAESNKQIKVIHKENGGLSDARNRGIDEAQGEYLAFIDSDDFIHPQMMEILYYNLKKCDADISVCGFHWLKESEEPCTEIGENVLKVFHDAEIMGQLFKNKVETVIAWNKLYRKELFQELRYSKGRLHEDEYIIHHLLYKCKTIVYTGSKLYYYMQHEESITGKLSPKRVVDTIDAFEQRIEFLEEKGMLRERNEAIKAWLYGIDRIYENCGTERFEGYRQSQRWLREKMRQKLSYLHTIGFITSRERTVRFVWTVCPVCGMILKKMAIAWQKSKV